MNQLVNIENNLGPHEKYPKSVKAGIPKLKDLQKGWSRVKIGDLFYVISRPVEMHNNESYDLVTVKRSRGGIVKRQTLKGDQIAVKSQFYVKQGDFLISKRQIVHGACGFITEELDGAIVSNEYSVLCCKEIIKPEFLNFLMHTPYFQQTCFHSSIGVHVEKLIFKLEEWFLWSIDIPQIEEQMRIARLLKAVEEKKYLLVSKYNYIASYKRGILQKLFSQQIRFKDGNGNNYPDWSEKRFEDCFKRVTRKNKENNSNVLTISAQSGLINQEEYFNKSVSAKDVTGYYLLKKGEFAYNKSYSKGYPMGAIKRLNDYEKGVVSTLYICFKSTGGDDNFWEQYFEAGLLNREIHKIAQEGARNHGLLNVSVVEFFRDIKVIAPELDEQVKIANVLSVLDNKINLVAKQIELTQTFNKGLLQQMFV